MAWFRDCYIEQIVEFDQRRVENWRNMIVHDNKTIIALANLENEGLKERQIALSQGTFEYAIFCVN